MRTKKVQFILNILIHVFILFTFLSVFYFTYISKVQKYHMEKEIKNSIEDGVEALIESIEENDTISDEDLREILERLYERKDSGVMHDYAERTEKRNTRLKIINGVMILLLLLSVVGMVVYYGYVQKKRLDLSHIIVLNVVAFAFVGFVEFLFFKNVASKYIPIYPDDLMTIITARAKKKIVTEF